MGGGGSGGSGRKEVDVVCKWEETRVLMLIVRFGGVVVITSASHAEGPQFEPGSNQPHFSPADM